MINEKALKIYPSLLSARWISLKDELEALKTADGLHLDIMDGHFVPNLSFGETIVQAIRKEQKEAFLDCHLMVQDPLSWISRFATIPVSRISIHWECDQFQAAWDELQKYPVQRSIAIHPQTPIESLRLPADSQHVLLMSVVPGFGGQAFLPQTIQRLEQLKIQYPDLEITVDGGINETTIHSVQKANGVVIGSALWQDNDPQASLRRFQKQLGHFF